MIVFSKSSKRELSQRKLEAYERYCKVIDWGRKDPVEFAKRFMWIELLDIQKYAIYQSWNREFILWLESRNAGKALDVKTPIPTPNGYKAMGELEVGDTVYDDYMIPTEVIYTSNIFYNHDCYELFFESGEKIVADADHLWSVKNICDITSDYMVLDTKKLFDIYNTDKHLYYGIPALYLNRKYANAIISIKKTDSVPTKCIQVKNQSQLYLCGKTNVITHNTTKLAIYPMLRSLLIPYHITYYLGNTGDQAKESFKKMEKIAKNEIESFVGTTDFFWNELKKQANSDGFVHDPGSFRCELFNNSAIYTLNSDIVNIKGKRANLVCYDEAGWFSEELFVQSEQFVNQDQDFKTGAGIDVRLEPKGFSRQLLYASSASDTSSEYFKKYKQFSEAMLIGDPKYFVCDFNVDVVMNATKDGDPYISLISKDKVDKAMSENKEKAMRELYNKFSADSHEGQIVTRSDIIRNSYKRPPTLFNDGSKTFIAAYDSARMTDNSILGWASLREDSKLGLCMDIENVISMVDRNTKNKTPLRLPEQVEVFKKAILDYNGSMYGALDYENIKIILCDAGAGGQMIGGITDHMLADWEGYDGQFHKGLIDKTHRANETAILRFPNAVDLIRLVEPKANRNDIFDAADKMTKLGVVTFPESTDGKDYIMTIDDDGNEHRYDLSIEEQLALAQIELMKNEIVTMCKYENAGSITYNYPPDKRNKMHDDRAFVYGLLCWYLSKLRHKNIVDQPITSSSFSVSDFKIRMPNIRGRR